MKKFVIYYRCISRNFSKVFVCNRKNARQALEYFFRRFEMYGFRSDDLQVLNISELTSEQPLQEASKVVRV